MPICYRCENPNKKILAKGLCRACYYYLRRRRLGLIKRVPKSLYCINCGSKNVFCRDLCKLCYYREYREQYKSNIR